MAVTMSAALLLFRLRYWKKKRDSTAERSSQLVVLLTALRFSFIFQQFVFFCVPETKGRSLEDILVRHWREYSVQFHVILIQLGALCSVSLLQRCSPGLGLSALADARRRLQRDCCQCRSGCIFTAYSLLSARLSHAISLP